MVCFFSTMAVRILTVTASCGSLYTYLMLGLSLMYQLQSWRSYSLGCGYANKTMHPFSLRLKWTTVPAEVHQPSYNSCSGSLFHVTRASYTTADIITEQDRRHIKEAKGREETKREAGKAKSVNFNPTWDRYKMNVCVGKEIVRNLLSR